MQLPLHHNREIPPLRQCQGCAVSTLELPSTSNGALFARRGTSGGQVEGCVAADENGWIFIGEDPYGLW